MIMEPAELSPSGQESASTIMTKSGNVYEQETARQRAHAIQTRPLTHLLNSVVCKDSTYVLVMTQKDALAIGATKAEYELMEEYVNLLNKYNK